MLSVQREVGAASPAISTDDMFRFASYAHMRHRSAVKGGARIILILCLSRFLRANDLSRYASETFADVQFDFSLSLEKVYEGGKIGNFLARLWPE